jgi:hypothetical protein
MIKSLRDLLENPSMLRKAREHSLKMSEKFDIAAVADKYEILFEKYKR